MGESSLDRAPFEWNRSIEIDGSDESVSADAGALLIREILEHSRIALSWLEEPIPAGVRVVERNPVAVLRNSGFWSIRGRSPCRRLPAADLPQAKVSLPNGRVSR